jgi:hypothetical protein
VITGTSTGSILRNIRADNRNIMVVTEAVSLRIEDFDGILNAEREKFIIIYASTRKSRA